ncbi:MAG: hypothetical protein CVU49_06455 [Candidatus Cloacimonetes bacterium HGW-Cloacimonetes-2]|jgi:tetratricopeptide (TPR) repeat protein|nr:MAG: hypothetical protein CVU49_06455 [Candidatus Cloacimonetes bacterium HGW-Cloacimonetes-2]
MTANELNNLLLRVEILARKNWIYAIHLLEEAERDHPGEPRIHSTRAAIFFERHRFKDAARHFLKALEYSPANPQLLYMLGNSYFAQGEYRLALVYYDQVPNDSVELEYNRALTKAYLGRNQESIDMLEAATKKYGPQVYIYNLLIEQLLRMDKLHKASAYLAEAEKKLPPNHNLALMKGLIYYRREIWLTAYYSFRQADERYEIYFPEHLHSYANSAAKCGFIQEAIELFDRALTYSPYQTTLYEDYVKMLVEEQHYNLARKVLAKAKRKMEALSPMLRLLQERIMQESPI